MDTIQHLDQSILYFINGLHNSVLDKLMILFSGKLTWIPLYLLLIFGFYKEYRFSFWKVLFLLLIGITISDRFSSGFAKPYFERLRPCFEEHILSSTYSIVPCSGKFGFFSSHASNSFTIAVFCILVFSKNKYKQTLWIWASLIAISRVYLVKHYFTDIFVGAIIGTIIGWLVYTYGFKLFKLRPKK